MMHLQLPLLGICNITMIVKTDRILSNYELFKICEIELNHRWYALNIRVY